MPLYSYIQSKLKHLLVLMSFSILSISSNVIANDEVLAYPFNADSGRYWQYVSDRVMGGVSDGKVNLEQDGEMYYARLTGNVSTANNGGFIQLRASVSFANSEKDGENLKGVRLNARGNGETYYIHIRTNESWSPSDYYATTFEANSEWKMIDLPFKTFKRRWSKDSVLDPKKIRSFGIVAYGRDHISDISVSTIEFYY
ncbi:CIA30 family protein [Candidatus Pseudothioglobus singularis]|nr:CIA30 family protein [Candidatus Pseudothioglobus singularis]MDB4847691.1 CIA30 family protein [Candidatus Pseudothioglobus singularis]